MKNLTMTVGTRDLPETLSLLITTSPSPHHPTTYLLTTVLESLRNSPGLSSCPLTVIFDGYKIAKEGRLKSGRVEQIMAQNYEDYCRQAVGVLEAWVRENSRKRCLCDKPVWKVETRTISVGAFQNVDVTTQSLVLDDGSIPLRLIRAAEHIGFALAVRTGLEAIDTPFVMVLQHDWAFIYPFNASEIVSEMRRHGDIKYVGFTSIRTTRYTLNIHPALPPSIIPPDSYPYSIPLVRLYFWFDKPHIASTTFYRNKVFSKGIFSRGDFIEDRLGHIMLDRIKEPDSEQAKIAVWTEYGCFLWWPGEGTQVLRHINGRKAIWKGNKENQNQKIDGRRDDSDAEIVRETEDEDTCLIDESAS